MDSWEEAVSDVMYAIGMQCEATMLESKALIVLDAEMENFHLEAFIKEELCTKALKHW